MNTDELFALHPEDQTRVLSSSRPPIVHTHRKPGKPVTNRHHSTHAGAKHRGEPRPILDELRTVNANVGRVHV